MLRILRIFLNRVFLADLFAGADVQATIDTISKGVGLRGYYTWMMLASALLASIGLDVSSPAVIIGAMLISPLMNPILGVGLGIGINDRVLIQDALKNFLLAVAVSLLASWLYFSITPLGEITPELAARVRPTLLDAGVAFVGGVAGILATSRRSSTIAIPGVAIATALMPPLCTAGFGLATGRANFFFGAFYLFFLNAVLISVATYLMVQLLRFPHTLILDRPDARRVRMWVGVVVLLALVPSGWILFRLIQELRTKRIAEQLVTRWVATPQREVLQQHLELTRTHAEMRLFVAGRTLSMDSVAFIQAQLQRQSGRPDMVLHVTQMDVPEADRRRLADQIALDVLQRVGAQATSVRAVSPGETLLPAATVDTSEVAQLLREVRLAFPDALRLTMGRMVGDAPTTPADTARILAGQAVVLVVWNPDTKAAVRKARAAQLEQYLRARLRQPDLLLVVQQP